MRDGGLSVCPESRGLFRLSLSQAAVKHDDSGGTRIVKRAGDRSRDDVALALAMAAGVVMRERRRPKPKILEPVIVGGRGR